VPPDNPTSFGNHTLQDRGRHDDVAAHDSGEWPCQNQFGETPCADNPLGGTPCADRFRPRRVAGAVVGPISHGHNDRSTNAWFGFGRGFAFHRGFGPRAFAFNRGFGPRFGFHRGFGRRFWLRSIWSMEGRTPTRPRARWLAVFRLPLSVGRGGGMCRERARSSIQLPSPSLRSKTRVSHTPARARSSCVHRQATWARLCRTAAMETAEFD
jgi:hypothetical protein